MLVAPSPIIGTKIETFELQNCYGMYVYDLYGTESVGLLHGVSGTDSEDEGSSGTGVRIR